MNIVFATLVALALIAWGFLLGRITVQPEPPVGVLQTRLVVPAACTDALDTGDDLVNLLGEAIGVAARGADPTFLLHRAQPAVQDYKSTAARCRNLRGHT